MTRGARAWAASCDQHRQTPDRLRADDDVGHAGRALEDRVTFLLRHASGDRDHRVVPELGRHHAQLAEPRIELVFGPLADAARVDDDDVGVRGVVGRLVAGLLQQPGHALGVVDVHLAAERLDEVFFRHRYLGALRARLSLSPFGFISPFAFASP